MHEEFAGAFGVVVFGAGVFVGEDSSIDKVGLVSYDADSA